VQLVDRFGITYAVKCWPLGEDAVVYFVLALGGNAVVARAVLRSPRIVSARSSSTITPTGGVELPRRCIA